MPMFLDFVDTLHALSITMQTIFRYDENDDERQKFAFHFGLPRFSFVKSRNDSTV